MTLSTNAVILVMGMLASGKSTTTMSFADAGYLVLNRDTAGGSVANLMARHAIALAEGRDIVLDNTFLTAESRYPFIAAAKAAGRDIQCHWMQTSFEDCQVNAVTRMFGRYGQVFYDAAAIKAHPRAKRDPNIFPIAAMFAAKKRLNGDKKKGIPSGKPTLAEGFSTIIKVPFAREPWAGGVHKAIILDYDGTLRRDAKHTGGEQHYPTKLSEVKVLPNVADVLTQKEAEGYLLLGVTTQSGIGKGHLTAAEAEACIAETNRQIGLDIPALYCPHYDFPVQCYCRKPQVGCGVELILKYGLIPGDCIFVGDMKTDATFAARCGFQFAWADAFFGS